MSLHAAGRLEDSIEALRAATRVAPRYHRAQVWLAVQLFRLERWDECIAACEDALAIDGAHAGTWAFLGAARFEKGEFAEAARPLERAVELDATDSRSRVNLAQIRFAARKLEEGVALARAAIEIDGDAAVHGHLGSALSQLGRHEEALAAFREHAERNPEDASGHACVGRCLRRLERFDEAIPALREAIRLDPDLVEPVEDLAPILETRRDPGAIDAYRALVRLKPGRAADHYTLGNLLRANDALDEAVASYRSALSLDSDDAEVHCNLAFALGQLGEYEDSVAHFRRGHALGTARGAAWTYPSADWLIMGVRHRVRQLRADDETDAAIALLQSLSEEFPDVPALDALRDALR